MEREIIFVEKIEEINELRRKAEEGDCVSMNILSFRLYYSVGIKPDIEEARKWCLESAKRGNLLGEGMSQFLSFKENSRIRDAYSKIKEYHERYLQEGSREDDSYALCIMGSSLIYSSGVEKDYARGVEYTKRACKLDNAVAYADLGIYYENGYGVSKDLKMAEECFWKSFELGFFRGPVFVACMMLQGDLEDNRRALGVEILEKASEYGLYLAKYFLANVYFKGEVVQKDEDKAVRLYEEAGTLGDSSSWT